MEKITKVGFFHFGTGYAKPLEALESSLRAKGRDELSGALILLPEGFNIGKCYHDQAAPEQPEADVISRLKLKAGEYDIAFVATLILEFEGIRRNCACLIDAEDDRLLCMKMVPDGMGDYKECTSACDENNPILYGDAVLGCLICADINPSQRKSYKEVRPDRDRLAPFLGRLKSTHNQPVILCIPAHSHVISGPEASSSWRDYIVIFASSCGDRVDRGSRIGRYGESLAEADGRNNVIEVRDLARN